MLFSYVSISQVFGCLNRQSELTRFFAGKLLSARCEIRSFVSRVSRVFQEAGLACRGAWSTLHSATDTTVRRCGSLPLTRQLEIGLCEL